MAVLYADAYFRTPSICYRIILSSRQQQSCSWRAKVMGVCESWCGASRWYAIVWSALLHYVTIGDNTKIYGYLYVGIGHVDGLDVIIRERRSG